MMQYRTMLRTAAIVALMGAMAACGEDKVDAVAAPNGNSGLFRSYVALGNSITAGYQSGGINDSTQRQSYAALLAADMGTTYHFADLAGPGCPPPITDISTGARVGGGTGTTCFLRTPQSVTYFLNNVGVPGATVYDPIAPSTPFSNALTTIILGGKTQVAKALDADPSFVSAWVGNNDVLAPTLAGVLVPAPGISPGLTPVNTFITNYAAMANGLKKAPHLKGGIFVGVVDVDNIPALFPAESLLTNPAFKGAFDAYAGATTVVDANCVGSRAEVYWGIVYQIRAYVQSAGATGVPPYISCVANSPAAGLGQVFILDTLERAVVEATVTAYNTYIAAKADSLGFAYADPNTALDVLRATPGAIPVLPGFGTPTQPFGTYFSLDGIHPSGLGQKAIANFLVSVINAKYGSALGAIQ